MQSQRQPNNKNHPQMALNLFSAREHMASLPAKYALVMHVGAKLCYHTPSWLFTLMTTM